MKEELDDQYWSGRYKEDQAGWDIGMVSTPLRTYIDQLEDKHQKILIPGCGNAYEAEYLLENGFQNVTLVDISNVLIKQLEDRFYPGFRDQLHIVHGDFFKLEGAYDLIIEQTFFCALDPSYREDYVQKMHQLLKPGGKLVGLLFNRQFEHQGPPYGGSREEYLAYFEGLFSLKIFEACYNSIPPRQGNELFMCLEKEG